jgi:hypothetical protein
MIRLLAAVCLFSAASAALAVSARANHFTYSTPPDHPTIAAIVKGGGCAPNDNTARILKSAHPLDYAPNWAGTTYVGTGWTFMPKRYVVDPELKGGIYLQGNLINSRGATLRDDLFVLYAEWDCGDN